MSAPDLTLWLATLTEAERECFEERAAILEYDAGVPRAEAEQRARESIEAQRARESAA